MEQRESSDEEVTVLGDEAEESDQEDARAELARQICRGATPDAITMLRVENQMRTTLEEWRRWKEQLWMILQQTDDEYQLFQ